MFRSAVSVIVVGFAITASPAPAEGRGSNGDPGSPGSDDASGEDSDGPPRKLVAGIRGDELSSVRPIEPTQLESNQGQCPSSMVEIDGEYCPLVEQPCLKWLDEGMTRCAEFGPTKCLAKTVHKHYCVDRYEYPNKAGEKPVVMTTWFQARDACAAEGKRLCKASEWTLACEGEERLPYPYGYARSADSCNIDRPYPMPDERALANPLTRDAEAARLDQRIPSGAKDSCVSPYGVHDMTGNVDEWVINEMGQPYQSGLKGGYWGPVRTRCRPMTTAHSEIFSYYQIGFRCCADTNAVKQSPSPASQTPSLAGS